MLINDKIPSHCLLCSIKTTHSHGCNIYEVYEPHITSLLRHISSYSSLYPSFNDTVIIFDTSTAKLKDDY